MRIGSKLARFVKSHKRGLATVAATAAAASNAFAVGTADTQISGAADNWMATAAVIATAAIAITITWMGIRMLRRIK